MADEKSIYQSVESIDDSLENLSCDKWTIIGKNGSEKEDTDEDTNSTGSINEPQEPTASIEIIGISDNDSIDDGMPSSILEKHGDDSDGISVITESEAEHSVAKKKFEEINNCANDSRGILRMYEEPGERTTPQVGTILNVVIACSLAAIIGLGAGRILGMDDKCPVSSAIDFSSIKMESDMLIDRLKELTEVKDVLDEIKASIPNPRRVHKDMFKRGSKSRSKRSEEREKLLKISETYIFDPETTILEQLQTSFNTLCSVIDGVNPDNDFIQLDTSKTQSVIGDLIKFQKIIYTIVKELGDTGRPKEMEFFRNAETKIRNICKSLLNDLSYTVNKLTMKIHHKLNKVRNKLNKRLCMLKNSDSMYERIFISLDENNSFLESCDKILNVSLKPSRRSMKFKEENNDDEKISLKTLNESSLQKSASESEDDIYPRDSSSDSSIPDLNYNSDGYWKEKSNQRKEGKKSKLKSGKIQLENNRMHRKTKNNEPMKLSGDQSFKKSMTEVLVPEKTCPLTQEHWLESESIYRETERLEVPILNPKPLYSTIVKSVINATNLEIDENQLSRRLIPENTIVHVTAETNENADQELSTKVSEAKENLTETKHDVTPAESGVHFQTVKNLKEQRNANIRNSGSKSNEVKREEETQRREDISTIKCKDPRQAESIKKVPLPSETLKHCRKDKKCLNHSVASIGSIERSARPANESGKCKKSRAENSGNKKTDKIRNDDGKKIKKIKSERKTSFSLKNSAKKMDKGFKKRKDNYKTNDRLEGDWQLQRSQAREMYRNGDHRSEWFFDRADSRQDARVNMNSARSTKYHGRGKRKPIFESRMDDDEFSDSWREAKDMNRQKHSDKGRTAFTTKKMIKMPHRNNIRQSKRH